MTGSDQRADPKPHPELRGATTSVRTRLWRWFDLRTGADQLLRASLDEPVPGGARFAYVFGSALLFLFVSQVVTGVCLAVYYVPSPLTAHVTVSYIVKVVAAGAFLRSLHSYGSSAMVVVLSLHFLQTLFYGSYKGRRSLLWMAGCVLALLVLGMTFTGYVLRWDLKAYFAGSVGTSLLGDVPLIGDWLTRLLRGGEMMGALTLSRFYVLHVLVLPASILLFVAIHIFLFRKAGAAGPIAEDPVRPHLPAEPFYPKQVIIDMMFVLVVMGVLGMLAHFVPVELGPAADPSNSNYLPRPEWYFLPFFEWLKFWDGGKTVIGVVVIPTVLVMLVFLLPFLDRGLERRPWRRPIPVGSVVIVLLGLITLGLQSRRDDSRDPTTAAQVAQQNLAEDRYFHAPFLAYSAPSLAGAAAPAALSGAAGQGASVFETQQCSRCHGAGGAGGGTGPALIHVSDTLTPAQLTALLKQPNAKMTAGGMRPLTVAAADLAALVAYVSDLGGTSDAATPARASSASVSLDAPPAAASAPGDRLPGPPTSSAPTGNASAEETSGERIYQSDGCAACHGTGGQGTAQGPSLVAVGKTLSAGQVTTLLHSPTAKMKAGKMPPVTGSAGEIASLVAYVRGLSSSAPGQAPTPTAKPPARVMTQLESKGHVIFRAHGCYECHGVDGVGGTAAASALAQTGKGLPPALVAAMLLNPTIPMRTGGMPPQSLRDSDMNALAAYVSYISFLGASKAGRR